MLLPQNPINRWWSVLAGALGTATGAGVIVIYAFGIFGKGMLAEYDWSRSVYSYAVTSFMVASGVGSVWLGFLIARYGIRLPAFLAVAAFTFAVAVIAILPPSPVLLYTLFAIIGITGSAATAMPYAIAISGWFDRQRGLALGLVNVGAGFGSALTPQIASWLDRAYGWQASFAIIGVLYGSIAMLALILLVREPRRESSALTSGTLKQPAARFSFIGDKDFWLIGVPMLGISVVTIGLLGSIVPLLSDRGMDSIAISMALSVAGACSWISRVAVGYAMDRAFAPYVAAVTFALALAGVALLALANDTFLAVLGAALIGIALGAEGDLITFLVSRYFSAEIYSKALGTMWIAWAWGGGIGSYVVGSSFESTGSYALALWTFSAVLVISAIVVCLLGPYRYPPATHHSDAGSLDLSAGDAATQPNERM
jgi:MFS family permease